MSVLGERPVKCVWGQFKCSNHQCVDFELVCNGVDDCGDLSDELGCGRFTLLRLIIVEICLIMTTRQGN